MPYLDLHEEKYVEEAQKNHHGVEYDPVHWIGLVEPVIGTWKGNFDINNSDIFHNYGLATKRYSFNLHPSTAV